MRRGWRGALCLAAVVLSLTGLLRAADAPPQPDPVDQAKEAMRQGQYLIARDLLRKFLAGSVGPKKVSAARELFEETYTLQVSMLLKAKQPVQAARAWIEAVEFYKEGQQADRVRKNAQTCLEDAFKDAARRKDANLIVEVAEGYAEIFPSLPPLVPTEQLSQYRADALAAAVQKRYSPEALSELLTEYLGKGVMPETLKARKVQIAEIRRAYAQSLIDEGYLAKGIKVLEQAMEEVTEAERARLNDLLGRALMMRLDSFASLGNLAMAEQALAEVDKRPALVAANKARVQQIRAAIEKKKVAVKPGLTVIKSDEPLTGKGQWVDEGQGYTIEGTVTLKDADIVIEPGFVLEKGSIYIESGSLHLQGSPQRPIIIRKVHFSQNLGGDFKAEFAIFEDCTFGKGGYGFARYSSKWQFTDCLLNRSRFSALTEVDYGVKIAGCAFFDCLMPPRPLCPNPPGDAAAKYRDEWNVVEACGFVKCKLPPSFVWMTRRCGFAQCSVEGWENYRSTTDLEVLMAVPQGSMSFLAALQSHTQHELPASVHYINANPQEAGRRRPMPAWRYIAAGE